MATTTNFGWETPDDTDLVKDGAAAMRTLGNSIDASFVDLKGGTTGQILSKNSNTDLDFTWIANDQGDITAVTAGTGISGGGTSGDVTITNSMATAIDAKGDLIAGTGADAFSRLAVGANNTRLVADSSTSTGLKWEGFVGCLAYNDTFSFTFTSGVAAAIAFPNEYFDTDAFHSTSSNTSRITIPSGKAGKYLITANIDQNGVSGYFICTVRQYNSGGTQINALGLNRQFSQNPGGNNFAGGTQTILADAAVGDYFEMYWQWGQASATVVNQYARLSAIYLGA